MIRAVKSICKTIGLTSLFYERKYLSWEHRKKCNKSREIQIQNVRFFQKHPLNSFCESINKLLMSDES